MMEVQSECVEPPVAPQCGPQPTGKINKAAFKLFGKRRTGSGMASFFSFRNKGATNSGNNGSSDNGNGSAAPVELVRSKTHDGLTSSNNDADGNAGERLIAQEAGPVRSLSKSFSFFSLLRRGSFRSSENGGAGFARRGRSLKGFFSSMRWRRKDKTNEGDGGVLELRKEKDGDVTHSEKVKDITLTLEPPPHHHLEDCRGPEAELNEEEAETPATSTTITPSHCVAMPGPSCVPDSPFPYTPTDSPIHPSVSKAKASVSSLTPSLATPPPDRCSTGDPPSEPSVDRLCSLLFTDVTSLKSFDSLTGCGDIIADAEEEGPAGNGGNGGSGTSSSSSGGGSGSAGVSAGRAAATVLVSPTKPRLPSQMAQAMYSISPSAVPVSLHARSRVTPALQQPPAGSGVVAYMGGGEEMASPEGVDDADMQGLWHMLPSTGENSPALPRCLQPPSSTPTATYPPCSTSNPTGSHLPLRSADRKVPQVKALGLSKIPVVGVAGGRAAKPPLPHLYGHHATSPNEKELLSDEGYWDTPSATPTATPDESGLQRSQKVPLSRDSCSGDHLYDLYNDPEEEGEDDEQEGDEDLASTPSPSSECKQNSHSPTTPPPSSSSTSFRSLKGSTSLPRESKIPVSTRQATPPHSVSQSSLSSVQETETHPPKNQAPAPARTRIPVSKMPVRRSGNKPGSSSRGTGFKK